MEPWDALNEGQRTARCEVLARHVRALLKESVGAYYADAESDCPNITVFASAQLDGGQVQLRFVADHYVYNRAWSGSDWADHYFGLGEAVMKQSQIVSLTFTRTRRVALDEAQTDDYDPAAIAALVCAEAAANHRNEPFDASSIASAIDAMKGVTKAKVEAARARQEAEATSPPPPTSRCPKCSSTDAGIDDLIMEVRVMRCNACGFTEHLTWMDEDRW